MRRPVRLLLATLAAAGLVLPAGALPAGAAAPAAFSPTLVGTGVAPSVQGAPASSNGDRPHREHPLRTTSKPGGGGGGSGSGDGAVQPAGSYGPALGAVVTNVDGVGVGINPSYADCCAPPDTNAAVGPTQVVEWVNLDFAVFDKATGALVSGPTAGSAIWSGFAAGNCATNNDGDPIVKYDQLSQRWIMTQFSVTGGPPYYQCVAVSSGSDFLASTWNLYAYSFGSNFPDYPKLAVWPGAYFITFNLFANGRTFAGAAACALDLARPGAGGQARCFQLGTGVASLLPSDLDGGAGVAGSTQPPPAGSPDYLASFGTGSLNLWRFQADFGTSTFSLTGPTSIAVPAFAEACRGGACIAQPGTSQQLDSLGDRLMYRLAYRNFGGLRESMVVNHSVVGSGTAAPRWYELRTGQGTTAAVGSGAFQAYQASSYAPDATYRWMGSAAMDRTGSLAIGYSASSASTFPSIRFAARAASDALNTLRAETVIQAGGGSQSGGLARWGDYSSMAVDPADDCTLWYASEYLKSTGSFNWSTHLAAIKLGGC